MGAAFVQLRHLLVWLRDGPRPRPLLFAFQWERNTSALHTRISVRSRSIGSF